MPAVRHLQNKLPDDVVHSIIRGAVKVEHEFICEALSCDLVGMNSELMKRYIEFVADRLLQALGHPKLYNATNPFDWMNSSLCRVRPISLRNVLASTRKQELWHQQSRKKVTVSCLMQTSDGRVSFSSFSSLFASGSRWGKFSWL